MDKNYVSYCLFFELEDLASMTVLDSVICFPSFMVILQKNLNQVME